MEVGIVLIEASVAPTQMELLLFRLGVGYDPDEDPAWLKMQRTTGGVPRPREDNPWATWEGIDDTVGIERALCIRHRDGLELRLDELDQLLEVYGLDSATAFVEGMVAGAAWARRQESP